MRIGVDFDNTIVCYDSLFHAVALERALITPDVPASKEHVRNAIREHVSEESWTELQGHVYGVAIDRAAPFPGALEFFAACAQRGVEVCVVSHRTRLPQRGPEVDLHSAARRWLQSQRFHDPDHGRLSAEHVFFEATQRDKIARIVHLGCRMFIDDLPEFLSRADFPADVQRILFDPHGRDPLAGDVERASSWAEILTSIESRLPL